MPSCDENLHSVPIITEVTPRQDNYKKWPMPMERVEVKWFPARNRLIGLVRANGDKYVLPPAVVRKAAWRD